jgi:hypothetical protein
MKYYLVEICELPLKYLWSNTLVSVFGDGSAGAIDTSQVFGISMDFWSKHVRMFLEYKTWCYEGKRIVPVAV